MQTILIIGLLFCHFLADFTRLSTDKMLKQKSNPRKYGYGHIFFHALTHGYIMLVFLALWVTCFFIFKEPLVGAKITANIILLVSAVEVITHFAIDVAKGLISIKHPRLADNTQRGYWYLFGFDQFLHVTIIVLISHFVITHM